MFLIVQKYTVSVESEYNFIKLYMYFKEELNYISYINYTNSVHNINGIRNEEIINYCTTKFYSNFYYKFLSMYASCITREI